MFQLFLFFRVFFSASPYKTQYTDRELIYILNTKLPLKILLLENMLSIFDSLEFAYIVYQFLEELIYFENVGHFIEMQN